VSDWNQKIIAEFRENGGKVGGPFEGAPMIILHTVGARSGAVRETPLVRFPESDDEMVVIASAGGAPKHPAWYHNIVAHPRFDVEVGTERFPVDATVLDGEERERVWERVVARMPGFGEYQQKTSRTIPVIRLVRAA
jgi:deazaflavin-dependent oxidoreductase (nitroreductase family)